MATRSRTLIFFQYRATFFKPNRNKHSKLNNQQHYNNRDRDQSEEALINDDEAAVAVEMEMSALPPRWFVVELEDDLFD